MATVNSWPDNHAAVVPNFTVEEVQCKCRCGGVPEWGFMLMLQGLRDTLGFALPVTSGFRCAEYDAEVGGAGVHPQGHAVDIAVARFAQFHLNGQAYVLGFTGIGVRGKGDKRFTHLDALPEANIGSHPRPRFWTYDT